MGLKGMIPAAEQTDPQANLIYLHNLVALANAFGVIDARKKEFLILHATRLGIDASYLDYILKIASGIIITIPDSIVERIEYLEKSVEMSLIDEHITQEELNTCHRIAKKLYLNSTILEEIISYQEIKIVRN